MSTLLLQLINVFGFIVVVLLVTCIVIYLPKLLGKFADSRANAVSSNKQLIQSLNSDRYEQEKEKVKGKEGEATFNQIYF